VPVMSESPVTSKTGPQPWANGWRRLLLAAGMLVYPGIAAATIHLYSSGVAAIVGYVLVAAFSGCYVAVMFSAARGSRRRVWVLLAVMTLLFIVELWFARANAFYLCAVVVSVAVLPLRRRVLPLVVVAVAACLVVPLLTPSWRSGPAWTQAVMVLFTVLLWFAFSEIARANQMLVETRAEVARLASEAERNRIARDLHDLVGHSLTAITVKSNLARQLAAKEGSPALREITEVEQLSRQALADVRAAVSGYREVTLAGELARARELLRASGIAADVPSATEPIDPATQELFGWVVREGITNVVRHARASRCTIAISATAVEICDDGTATHAADGNGLTGLRERAAGAGAFLEAGPTPPQGWRLRVALESGRAA
jgi:two-component system, NarL family, sensor histidine kinase DesK